MKHPLDPRWLVAVGTLAVTTAAAPATANPGILHKHGHRALGVPMTLPGQTSGANAASAAGGTAAAPSVTAAGTSGVVAVTVATPPVGVAAGSAAGSVGAADGVVGTVDVPMIDGAGIDPGAGVDGGPVCIMPLPTSDGGPPVMIHHLRPGFVPGAGGDGFPGGDGVDPGIGDSGLVTIMPVPVDGIPVDGIPLDGTVSGDATTTLVAQPMGFFHAWRGGNDGGSDQPMAAAAMAGPTATDTVSAVASARAGGLPARAVGVRGDAVAATHPHRHGAASVTPRAPGDATGDDAGSPGAGSAKRATPAGAADVARAGAAAGAASAAAPRWRDRLRVVWPGAK